MRYKNHQPIPQHFHTSIHPSPSFIPSALNTFVLASFVIRLFSSPFAYSLFPLFTMSSSGATYCSFTALVQIQRMDSPAKAYNISLSAEFATSPAGEALLEIESPERIAIPIEYYNGAWNRNSYPTHTFFASEPCRSTPRSLQVQCYQSRLCKP
jgi:hypothetical protein